MKKFLPGRRSRLAAGIGILLVASLTSPATTAGAQESPSSEWSDQIVREMDSTLSVANMNATVTESAAPMDLLSIEDGPTPSVSFETDQGNSVEILSDETTQIELETAGNSVDLTLPTQSGSDAIAADGSVVFSDQPSSSSLIAQAQTDGGVRLLAVLNSESAASTYHFSFDSDQPHSLQLISDGSVAFIVQDEPLYYIPKPWAFDAQGRNVPSWYSIDDDSLVLHVDHSKTISYPVVADPQLITNWWGWTIKLDSQEVNTLRGLMIAGAGASAIGAYVCGSATGGICAVPFALGGAILVIGNGAILACSNSNGVDIHGSPLFPPTGAIWCSGY